MLQSVDHQVASKCSLSVSEGGFELTEMKVSSQKPTDELFVISL